MPVRPATALVRTALVELRQRGGITPKRLREHPVILTLPLVDTALTEQARHPDDRADVAYQVLRCEVERGNYAPLHREILFKTLNFDVRISELSQRREDLRTKYQLYGNDYESAEELAYDLFSSTIVMSDKSPCSQNAELDPWRDMVNSFNDTIDKIAMAQLAQALSFFRATRDPEDARRRAREILEQLPLAVKHAHGVIWHQHFDPTLVLNRVLFRIVQDVYGNWITLLRSMTSDRRVYLSDETMLWWAQANFGGVEQNATHLSYQEQKAAFDRNRFIAHRYWNSDGLRYPLFNTGERSKAGQPTATYALAEKRSVAAIAGIMLATERSDDWARIFGPGSDSSAREELPSPIMPPQK